MATFRTFFEESVPQARATVLVQGPHLSGKSTLLNALLGSHLFPYFHSPKHRHGGDGRFTAGQGATSVCIVGAAAIDGPKLSLTQPPTATIMHVVAPNALLIGGDSFSDSSAGKSATGRAEDRTVSISSFSENQSRLESSYFASQGTNGVVSKHPMDHTNVQPFRQALNSMETTWLHWMEGEVAAEGTAERLLFFADLRFAAPNEVGSVPLLNFVESTDLSDRPPMTYVHTAIVVLSEAREGFGFEDREGARRMYVKSATYAKSNTVAAIVYNLTQTKAAELSAEGRDNIKQTLSRMYDVDSDTIFVLNLRNALADALLRQQSTEESSLISPLDWEELVKLRGLIARNHVSAYSRSQLRLKGRNTAASSKSLSSTHPSTTNDQYLPKSLSEQYRQEDRQVSFLAAEASCSRDGPAPKDSTLRTDVNYVPVVSREETAETERRLLRRKAEEEAKAATATVEKLHHGDEVARSTSQSQDAYIPKCMQEVPLARISPPPSEVRRSPQQPAQKSPPYIPKCVLARRENEEVAAATLESQKQYVPKFMGTVQQGEGATRRASPSPAPATAAETSSSQAPGADAPPNSQPEASQPIVAPPAPAAPAEDAILPLPQAQPQTDSGSPHKSIRSFSTSSSFDMLEDQ